jgi:hypothetical protein
VRQYTSAVVTEYLRKKAHASIFSPLSHDGNIREINKWIGNGWLEKGEPDKGRQADRVRGIMGVGEKEEVEKSSSSSSSCTEYSSTEDRA